ncbi:MAG: pyridoxamine 5'-phosphate oxidase family protein [Sphaerochaetaceae bacterium]
MRREDRAQSEAFARRIFDEAEYGVLSLVDQDNRPYSIPVSPAIEGNTIYIHSAVAGKKLDLIASNNYVSVTCVGTTKLLPAEFATLYESATAFGKAKIVTDDAAKRQGLMVIARKYSPEYTEEAQQYITKKNALVTLIQIEIETLSAKARLI